MVFTSVNSIEFTVRKCKNMKMAIWHITTHFMVEGHIYICVCFCKMCLYLSCRIMVCADLLLILELWMDVCLLIYAKHLLSFFSNSSLDAHELWCIVGMCWSGKVVSYWSREIIYFRVIVSKEYRHTVEHVYKPVSVENRKLKERKEAAHRHHRPLHF